MKILVTIVFLAFCFVAGASCAFLIPAIYTVESHGQ